MKTKKNCFSRALVLMMAFMLVFTMMPSGMWGGAETAYAGEETISVNFSAVIPVAEDNDLDPNETGWHYAAKPQTLTVYAGLAYEYGIGTSATKKPTVLDAVVAAHKEKYGEAFTRDTASQFMNSGLGSYSSAAAAFNVANVYFGHVINGMYSSDYASNAIVQDGDKVELFPYKATYPASDYYASFGRDEIIVDKATAITVKGAAYFALTSPATVSALGEATVGYINDDGVIVPLSCTDSEGNMHINDADYASVIDGKSEYTLVVYGAYGESGDLIMPSALHVTVKDTQLTDEDIAENIKSQINWNLIQNQNTQNAYIESNLTLPTTINENGVGYDISWKSSNSNRVKTNGTVKGADLTDTEVVLTAEISVNEAKETKYLHLIVKQKTPEIVSLSDADQEKKIQNIIYNLSDRETVEALDAKLLKDRDFLIPYLMYGGVLTEAQKTSVLRQVLIDAQGEVNATNIGALGKDVLLLTAMGIDARYVKAGDKTINLIDKIAMADISLMDNSMISYKIPYILFAYDCHENYTLPKDATITRGLLLKSLLDIQNKAGDGSFTTYSNPNSPKMAGDVASVAQAYAKYLNYKDDKIVEGEIIKSLNKAKQFITDMQTDKSYFGNSNQNAYIILFKSLLNENARDIDKGIYQGNDIIDALLSENIDDQGFVYGGKYNTMATADSFRALAAFSEYIKNGDGNIYDFSGRELVKDTVWPSAKYPVELYIIPPTKSTYQKGETLDLTGMKVSVKYSDGTVKELKTGEYTVGKLYSSSVGVKQIKVEYSETTNGIETKVDEKFVVNVVDGASVEESKNTVTTTVKNAKGEIIASGTTLVASSTTVMDVLKQVLAKAGKTATIENGYVSSIDGEAEFDYGGNSGWMVKVDGVLIDVSAASYKLKGGEQIEWFYTKDWTSVSGAVVPVEDTNAVTSDKTAGTTTSPTDVKVSEKTNADGTKESVATVTVSADNQKEILKQAKANKSKEIILQVSKDSVKDATKADVQLDKSFIESVLKDTDAKLTVKTPFGDKTYTQEELKALAAAAAGKTVSLEIVKSEKTEDELKAEQLEAAKATVAKASMKARSTKTAKGNVKIVFKPDTKTQNFIQEMKDMGYTVKYRFYRSTKKSSGYKAMLTKTSKTYTNTSGKKGTKYYYKVQVRVYDENGKCVAKTALKQCKYASRTWKK